MPKASVQDPEQLTKVTLQKELKKHGIKFGKADLKADLVKLYRINILKRSAFSSDEEEEPQPVARITRSGRKFEPMEPVTEDSSASGLELERSISLESTDLTGSRRSPRKIKKPSRYIEESESARAIEESQRSRVQVSIERLHLDKMAGTSMAIQELSDDELTQKLRERGINVGPVGPTTRNLYERKLEKILEDSGVGDAKISAREYSDQDSAEEEDEDDVEIVDTPAMETRNRRRQPMTSSERVASATRRRPLHSKPDVLSQETIPMKLANDPTPSAGCKEEVVKSERRWAPVWVSLLIVAGIVIFLYFVFISMEQNPRKQIKSV